MFLAILLCKRNCLVFNDFNIFVNDILFEMILTDKNLELIRKYFSNQPVSKAYVFGSFARNEADEKSDLDLLVDLDYSQKIGLKFFQMALDLEKILGYKVDLVSSEGVSPHILSSISKDQKLIYAR